MHNITIASEVFMRFIILCFSLFNSCLTAANTDAMGAQIYAEYYASACSIETGKKPLSAIDRNTDEYIGSNIDLHECFYRQYIAVSKCSLTMSCPRYEEWGANNADFKPSKSRYEFIQILKKQEFLLKKLERDKQKEDRERAIKLHQELAHQRHIARSSPNGDQ